MRIPLATSIMLLVLGTATAIPARAQSLAEVARLEDARRKAIKSAEKTYTNGDLKPVPPPSAAATGAPPPAAGATAAEPAAAPLNDAVVGEPAADPPASPTVKDETYWRTRMSALRNQLERDTSYAEAMQSRINALTTEFTNRDDPAQRARIGVERQKALADLGRLQTAIENEKKAIADFEEEARRAGALPGWLREGP